MTELTQMADDVRYVKGVVERSPEGRSPASIYFLWAVLVLVGFSLNDFQPEIVGTYWLVAGIGGFLLSAFLGRRAAGSSGAVSRRWGMRQGMHWLTLLASLALSALPVLVGRWTWDDFAVQALLVIGVVYFLAGVHLDRPLLGVGAALLVGYPLVLLAPGPAWTLTGILVAVALVAAGVWTRSQHGPTS